jgi:hypothetical protein
LTGEGRGGLFKTNPGNVSHTLPQKWNSKKGPVT